MKLSLLKKVAVFGGMSCVFLAMMETRACSFGGGGDDSDSSANEIKQIDNEIPTDLDVEIEIE